MFVRIDDVIDCDLDLIEWCSGGVHELLLDEDDRDDGGGEKE